jgi:hypothetical protein
MISRILASSTTIPPKSIVVNTVKANYMDKIENGKLMSSKAHHRKKKRRNFPALFADRGTVDQRPSA